MLDLLQCPRCGGTLRGQRVIACESCGAEVRQQDGVLDFVAGASSTQLDDIDYDQFYAIDAEHARTTYDGIRKAAGDLWRSALGDAVEIGCGTGGFTMAALANMSAGRVLLTDVSPKMLGICRARLQSLPTLRARDVAYATYAGQQACFRPAAFDTCYGTAVVHHVLDVPLFLRQVHRLLKPGGVAFFMEPNLEFHRALTATLADIAADWLRHRTVPETDLIRMLNWTAEVHCNIMNTGDLEILANREDKHQFTAAGFEAMARDAGFASARSLACGPDPDGSETIIAYLRQAGVSPETLLQVRSAWGSAPNARFAALARRDSAPSYLFWLETSSSRSRPLTQATAAWTRPTRGMPPPRFWISLARCDTPEGTELAVEGWCVSGQPARAIEVSALGQRRRLPIWLPRPDVQAAVNADGSYPPLHALCSGIEGHVSLGCVSAAPVQASIDIVAGDTTLRRAGTVTLARDGPTQVIE